MADLNLRSGLVRSKWMDNGLKICPPEDDIFISSFDVGQHLPKVWYRNMPEFAVDEFLSTGRLRLCNFESCANIPDECRKDGDEGVGGISVTDGRMTIEMFLRMGMNPLMLCCTESLDAYREHDAYLKITDPQGLGDAITQALISKGRRIRSVACERCEYGNRLVMQNIPPGFTAFNNMLSMVGSGVRDFDYWKFHDFIKTFSGNHLYFMKPSRCASEKEIRMLWDCNRLESDQYEYVIVANPQQYGEKLLV